METFTADALKKAFEAKTGLQMEYWRGGSTEVLDRVARASTASANRYSTSSRSPAITCTLMAKEGAFAKYESPSFKGFAKDAIDPISALAIETSCTA